MEGLEDAVDRVQHADDDRRARSRRRCGGPNARRCRPRGAAGAAVRRRGSAGAGRRRGGSRGSAGRVASVGGGAWRLVVGIAVSGPYSPVSVVGGVQAPGGDEPRLVADRRLLPLGLRRDGRLLVGLERGVLDGALLGPPVPCAGIGRLGARGAVARGGDGGSAAAGGAGSAAGAGGGSSSGGGGGATSCSSVSGACGSTSGGRTASWKASGGRGRPARRAARSAAARARSSACALLVGALPEHVGSCSDPAPPVDSGQASGSATAGHPSERPERKAESQEWWRSSASSTRCTAGRPRRHDRQLADDGDHQALAVHVRALDLDLAQIAGAELASWSSWSL